jgi:hypothetical protein
MYKYPSKASNASQRIVSFSRQLLFSSHLEMKSCWFNQIFLAASAKVSSRTRAIL